MGRHKQFERSDVTNKALFVFWQKGYLDTSLKDLEEATGVFKPALYSEFGDKLGLFLECIKFYRENYARERLLRRDPMGWQNIEDFLKPETEKKCEKGCFEVDVFSRDLLILERELKRPLDNGLDHIPPLIHANLEVGGVASQYIHALTNTIFTFYCGLSVLGKAYSEEKIISQVDEFLEQIRNCSA